MLYNKIYRRIFNTDAVMVVCMAALSVISVYALFELSEHNHGYLITRGFSSRAVMIQALSVLIGIVLFLLIILSGEGLIRRLTPFVFIICFALTVLTLTPLGVTVDDDKAWLSVMGVSVQPSELLKAAMIAVLAQILSSSLRGLARYLLFFLVSGGCCAVVFLQRDMGTLLIFLIITAVMLFCSGVNKGLAALSVVVIPLVFSGAWRFILNSDQKARILSSLDPSLDPYGTGYQQLSARSAMTDGGLTGQLFSGSRDFVYVSSSHNDFILSFIAQLFGFAGVMAVCLLLAILIRRFARTDKKSRFVTLMSAGVMAALASQAVINTAMNLSLFPVVGIVLPFVSAGGTAVISAYAMAALTVTTQ